MPLLSENLGYMLAAAIDAITHKFNGTAWPGCEIGWPISIIALTSILSFKPWE